MSEDNEAAALAAHTVSSYDEELEFLTRRIAEMGGLAERMVEQSVAALVQGDEALSQKVISDDVVLDDAERQVDEKAVLVIAKRQPMASDLRVIIGSIRIAADLERIGDMAKNIAKRVIAVQGTAQPKKLVRGLEHLSELALTQLKEVLDAYSTRSAELANTVRDRDEEIDAIYTSLFRELLTYMMEDPRNIAACTHLLFCAKNIERIGDHTTNIAETVYYITTGSQLVAERPKDDETAVMALQED
ncbi:MAG: phosphate signaling complex protein PhoU [Pseudomonadota bacterium]